MGILSKYLIYIVYFCLPEPNRTVKQKGRLIRAAFSLKPS